MRDADREQGRGARAKKGRREKRRQESKLCLVGTFRGCTSPS